MSQPLVVPALAAPPFILRKFLLTDTAMIMQASTDSYITTFTSIPKSCTEKEAAEFIQSWWKLAEAGDGYPFVIVDAESDQAIGAVGLWLYEKERIFLGYWLTPGGRGRGATAICLRRVCERAHTELGLNNFELFIEPWNVASMKTAERAGFIQCEFLSSYRRIGGELRDVYKYVLKFD